MIKYIFIVLFLLASCSCNSGSTPNSPDTDNDGNPLPTPCPQIDYANLCQHCNSETDLICLGFDLENYDFQDQRENCFYEFGCFA